MSGPRVPMLLSPTGGRGFCTGCTETAYLSTATGAVGIPGLVPGFHFETHDVKTLSGVLHCAPRDLYSLKNTFPASSNQQQKPRTPITTRERSCRGPLLSAEVTSTRSTSGACLSL